MRFIYSRKSWPAVKLGQYAERLFVLRCFNPPFGCETATILTGWNHPFRGFPIATVDCWDSEKWDRQELRIWQNCRILGHLGCKGQSLGFLFCMPFVWSQPPPFQVISVNKPRVMSWSVGIAYRWDGVYKSQLHCGPSKCHLIIKHENQHHLTHVLMHTQRFDSSLEACITGGRLLGVLGSNHKFLGPSLFCRRLDPTLFLVKPAYFLVLPCFTHRKPDDQWLDSPPVRIGRPPRPASDGLE